MTAWAELDRPECAELLAALEGTRQEPSAAQIERLRQRWPAAVVAAAVELQWARTRATAKFGARARALWLDREGAEMASGPDAAAWKARRYAGRESVVDLCCGIGGDLMHLARAAPSTGVDRDEARAWMAARNAGVAVECRDALACAPRAAWVHADPGRRANGRRLTTSEHLQPALSDLRRVCAESHGVGIKLGPGMDLAAHERSPEDEVEFIAEAGTLTQQVLWTGGLARAPGCNTATHACTRLTISGAPTATPCHGDGRWRGMIAVPSPALERARLVHLAAAHAAEPTRGLGVLTADHIAPSPWLEVHRVLAELPARERTVAAWLRTHGGGVPTVRTRGKACDPDTWQAAIRGKGDAAHTVWVLRVGARRTALITAPAEAASMDRSVAEG